MHPSSCCFVLFYPKHLDPNSIDTVKPGDQTDWSYNLIAELAEDFFPPTFLCSAVYKIANTLTVK